MPPPVLPLWAPAATRNVLASALSAAESVQRVTGGDDRGEAYQGASGTTFLANPLQNGIDEFDVIVVATGPNGEADLSGGNYWGRTFHVRQTYNAPSAEALIVDVSPFARYLPFVHLPELYSHSHRLAPSTLDADGKFRGPLTVVRVRMVMGVKADDGTGKQTAYPVWVGSVQVQTGPILVRVCTPDSDTGADGTATTYASWKYDLYDADDTDHEFKLASSVQPIRSAARIAKGPVTRADNDTIGLGYKLYDGTVVLWDCQEVHGSSKRVCP